MECQNFSVPARGLESFVITLYWHIVCFKFMSLSVKYQTNIETVSNIPVNNSTPQYFHVQNAPLFELLPIEQNVKSIKIEDPLS